MADDRRGHQFLNTLYEYAFVKFVVYNVGMTPYLFVQWYVNLLNYELLFIWWMCNIFKLRPNSISDWYCPVNPSACIFRYIFWER